MSDSGGSHPRKKNPLAEIAASLRSATDCIRPIIDRIQQQQQALDRPFGDLKPIAAQMQGLSDRMAPLFDGIKHLAIAEQLRGFSESTSAVSDSLIKAFDRMEQEQARVDRKIGIDPNADRSQRDLKRWAYARQRAKLTDEDYFWGLQIAEVNALLEWQAEADQVQDRIAAALERIAENRAVQEKPKLPFNERLRALRDREGLTIEALAAELRVSRDSVMDWESGLKHPGPKNRKSLADFFRLTVEELMNG